MLLKKQGKGRNLTSIRKILQLTSYTLASPIRTVNFSPSPHQDSLSYSVLFSLFASYILDVLLFLGVMLSTLINSGSRTAGGRYHPMTILYPTVVAYGLLTWH